MYKNLSLCVITLGALSTLGCGEQNGESGLEQAHGIEVAVGTSIENGLVLGKGVGVGDRMYSTQDGDHWNLSSSNPGAIMADVASSSQWGRWIAVGYGGSDQVWRSYNGTYWYKSDTGIPSNATLYGVAWTADQSKVLAVGGSKSLHVSVNGGLNWDSLNFYSGSTYVHAHDIAVNPDSGRMIIASSWQNSSNGALWFSFGDVEHWYGVASVSGARMMGVTAGKYGFVAVGDNGRRHFSPDGIYWTFGYGAAARDYIEVLYGEAEDRYYAAGNLYGSQPFVDYSDDGTTWYSCATIPYVPVNRISSIGHYSAGRVVVSLQNGKTMHSDDGCISWTTGGVVSPSVLGMDLP